MYPGRQRIFRHAIQRARERYSLDVTPEQLLDCVRLIERRDPRCARLSVDDGGNERWVAVLAGSRVRVIYSPAEGRVLTVLTNWSAKTWKRFDAERSRGDR